MPRYHHDATMREREGEKEEHIEVEKSQTVTQMQTCEHMWK